MKSEDKDFIDNFFEFLKPYQNSGIRLLTIIIYFSMCVLLGLFLSPILIKQCMSILPFTIKLLQISPMELFFNYIKIALFFGLFLTAPILVYQFGKLKYENPEFNEKMDLLLASLVVAVIIIVSVFLVYKIIFPFEIIFLYGLNFDVSEYTSSISSIISFFIITSLFVIMLILTPFLRYLTKKSLLFNYATLIKYKKPTVIYMGILTALIFLPFEFIYLGFTFLLFFIWYKIIVNFAKKRD